MKNFFRTALAIAAASSMLVACDPAKTGNNANGVDSTSVQTSADSTITVDTAKTDSSMLGDTTAKAGDTITKTVKKTTVVKKSVTKND